jgi:hypothetical protein
MNKTLKFTSFLLLFSVIAFIGIQAYRLDFDLVLLQGYLLGLVVSGFLPLLDFTSLDLFYFLKTFAVLLFIISTVLVFFKTLFRGKIIFAFASLGSFLFLLVLALTSISEFYPFYPDLSVSESFIAPFISVIDGTNTSMSMLGYFIATVLFLFSFFAHQISLFTFFVRHPYGKKKTEPLFIESEEIIAQELTKFVVPNKPISVTQTSLPQPNIPIQTVPIAPQPQVVPVVVPPAIDLSGVIQAKSQVQSLKEKIRFLVRSELQKKVSELPIAQEEHPTFQKPKDAQVGQSSSQPEGENLSLEQKLLSYIETNIEKLQPQNKQMIIQMINEELIKYDSLNREAIETLVQERIEQVTQVALDQLKTDIQVVKDHAQESLNKTNVVPIATASNEPIEEKIPLDDQQQLDHLKEEMKAYIEQSVQESFKKVEVLTTEVTSNDLKDEHVSPELQEQLQQIKSEMKAYIEQSLQESLTKVDAPQTEPIIYEPSEQQASLDMQQLQQVKDEMKAYIEQSLQQSASTLINEEQVKRIVLPLIPSPVVTETNKVISPEEKQKIKEDILASIPPSTQQTITREEIIGIIEERLKGLTRVEPVSEKTQSVILPPKIKKAVIKAPDNEVRAEQFRSVLPPESDLTRTGKKKIIRVPFYQRMAMANPTLHTQYEELKNYLLSYRVKSRLSNTGDTFRLHKEEYAKISIAGKALKIHLALDPKAYEDTPIPVDDASDKKIYKNIPLVFKVKSGLSVKRAKKLIDDLMLQKGQPQKSIPNVAWAQQFIAKK